MSTLSASPSQVSGQKWMQDFFELNSWLVFLMLCLLYGFSTYIVQNFIITEEVYYNTLGEQLTMERIDEILQHNNKIVWVQVLAIPLVTVLQTALVAFCLNAGALVGNWKIGFGQLFALTLKASLIFGVSKVLKTIICLLTPIETLNDFLMTDYFSIFGLLTQVGIKLPELFIYPLSTINIFEVIFCYLLIMGLSMKLPHQPTTQLRQGVLASYGTGLAFWVLVVMFLQVNMQ